MARRIYSAMRSAYLNSVYKVIATNGKWEIYIGGAGGSHVRKGDLLCTVDNEESAIALGGRFIPLRTSSATAASCSGVSRGFGPAAMRLRSPAIPSAL